MKTLHHTSLAAMLLAAFVALTPGALRAASPSELLEKGIYTEETKGDLDTAIGIYQQLVAEAKAGQALAAQAQLRLGECLIKKNREAEAIAAFEKLVHDYPNEKDLVAKARAHLPSDLALGPVPWADGERLQLTISLAAGMEIGGMELRADLVDVGGRKAWRVGRRMSGGGEMLSSVEVEAENFHPLTSYWKHTLIGEATAVFKPGEAEIRKAGTAEPMIKHLDKTVYDNEEFMHMMRRLPLAVGYKTTIPTLTTLGGGAVLPVGLEVTGKETIEVPAGKFDCFKVPLSIAQTFWISDDAHRYLVKFEGGGAIMSLASITQRKAGTPLAFRDDALGISFATPGDWVIQRGSGERKGSTTIYLLDPAANADQTTLQLVPADSLTASVRQSARAWADEEIRETFAKQLEQFKVRADGWKNSSISGRLAVGFVADYVEMGKPKVVFSLRAVGPKACERFSFSCSADKYDALRPAVESIVASYRTTK
jgi:tetratricopeptide (TPR) repeat protein